MVTATGLTSLPGVADAAAFGDAPPTAPACAVHTEAPVASTVTPSAAPTSLPYQPRPPPCRAMSAPLSPSPWPIPGHFATTWQDEGRRPRDASVTDHGQSRGVRGQLGWQRPEPGQLARSRGGGHGAGVVPLSLPGYPRTSRRRSTALVDSPATGGRPMNATLTLDRRDFGSPTKRGSDTSSTFRAVRGAKALEAKRLDYSLGHRISGASFPTTPRLPPISRRQPYAAPDRGILRTATL